MKDLAQVMKKTILITGCSSGIGLCAAEMLHKKGYQVFATARKKNDVAMLREKGLESFQLDLAESDSIHHALETILKITHGTLDALFNNAGFAIAGATEDMTREMMRTQFETNVFGTMELTNLVLPIMRKQGYGRIIQNVSILGLINMPFRGTYSASKFALEAFSNTLRQELTGSSIYISIIEPGPIETYFRENAYENYKKTLHKKDSIHSDVYNNMEQHFFSPTHSKKQPFTLKPEAVVKKLIQALESNKPKTHYYVSFPAYLFAFLKRILPNNLFNWIILQVCHQELKVKA